LTWLGPLISVRKLKDGLVGFAGAGGVAGEGAGAFFFLGLLE